MAQTILILGFRFVLFAAVYVGLTFLWATQAGGYAGLAVIAGGVLLAAAAAIGWLIAAVVSRKIEAVGMRLFAHLVLAAMVFFVVGSAQFLIMGADDAPSGVTPFTGIVIVAAIVDGTVGVWFSVRQPEPGGG